MTGGASEVCGLVLHFRTAERTIACLHSLLEEGIRKVVVIDNSADQGASLERMHGGLAALDQGGLEVCILSPGKNLGFAAGVNLGLHEVAGTGLDVLLINSDARLGEGALRSMLDALARAPFVVPRERAGADAQSVSLIHFYQVLLALISARPWFGAMPHPSGCCLLIRRDYAVDGLLDGDFFFYGEDTMLGANLRRRGVEFTECVQAEVVHTRSASAKNGSVFYEYHMNRAHWLLGRKLARNLHESITFTCMRCIVLPLRATLRSLRFRSLVPWRGLCLATLDVARGHCRDFTPSHDVVEGQTCGFG